MSSALLELRSVSKAYGDKVAVDQVSLSIPTGTIFGLLGPNGAGKTSIIRMITSITAPDTGEILFSGKRLASEQIASIGYLPEERGLYKKMKVRDQLVYLLRLKGMKRKEAGEKVDFWLKRLKAAEWADKKIGELSKGMQQKIQFIGTVAHEPSLLILDEPFSGLDPINTQLIEDEIRILKEKGTTIIFSTHRMEQVEELCERIALIYQGTVVLEDEVQHARKAYQDNEFAIDFSGDGKLLSSLPAVEILELNPSNARLRFPDGTVTADILAELSKLDLEVIRFELHLPRLQEIFIRIVEKEGGSDE